MTELDEIAVQKARLEVEKLRIEVEGARRPLWQRPGYVASVAPIVIAMLTFASAWLTGYFDEERTALADEIAALTATRDTLTAETTTLSATTAALREEADALDARLAGMQGLIDTAFLQLRYATDRTTYALSHIPELVGSDDIPQVLGRVAKIAPAEIGPLTMMIMDQALTKDLISDSLNDLRAVREAIDAMPASEDLRDLAYDPMLKPDQLRGPDGRIFDILQREFTDP